MVGDRGQLPPREGGPGCAERGVGGREEHPLGARRQVAQAGLDVLAVVVALPLVEGGLCAQAPEHRLQLHQLRLPPLPVPALVEDVLRGDQGWGVGRPGPRAPGPDSG